MLLSAGTRVTFALSCKGYGWTITLYLPSTPTNFGLELAKAITLADKLNLATSAETAVNYIRLENATVNRQGLVKPYDSSGATTWHGVQPQSCAYLRLYNTNFTQTKLIFFRGLSTDIVTNGGFANPASAQIPAIAAFAAQLAADGWCWLGKALPGSNPGPIDTIVAQAQPNPAPVPPTSFPVVTMKQDTFSFPILANQSNRRQPLSLSGLKGSDTLNGTWVVLPTSAKSAVFEKQVLFNPWLAGTGTGYSRLETLVPFGLGTTQAPAFFIERFAERKCGRPLYLSRGRSNRKVVTY